MSKKTILIITPFMPFPLNSGGNISQFTMCDAIRHEHQLIMIFPLKKNKYDDFERLQKEWKNVKFFPYKKGVINKIHSLFGRKIPSLFYQTIFNFFNSPDSKDSFFLKNSTVFNSSSGLGDFQFIKHINNVLKNNAEIDTVQIEFFECISIAPFLPKSLKKLFVSHELRHIREDRELNLLNSYPDLLRYIYLKNRGFEISFLKEYDKIITITSDDYKILKEHINSDQLVVSPLTIKYGDLKSKDFKFNNSLLFLGGDDHFPNKEGINWFISNCWNTLQKKDPDLKLKIVGKWSEASINQYSAYSGIEFLGFVDDLTTVLINSIFIVPIRIGSGMRMKILDAVVNDIPFVTTTVGVEGLDFRKEIDCLVADTSGDFIAQIIRIIEDPALAKSLSTNAQLTISQKYSYSELIKTRLDVYENL